MKIARLILTVRICFIAFVIPVFSGCLRPRTSISFPEAILPVAPDSSIEDKSPIPSKYQELADQLESNAVSEKRKHFLSVIETGEDALAVRLHLIRAAKESIDVQTFIWETDESGTLILKELLAAARRGVQVRMLLDQITVGSSDPENAAHLATVHRNFSFRLFKPLSTRLANTTATFVRTAMTDFNRVNERMHVKTFTIDNRISIVGGRNIQNHYFDLDPVFNFRDRDILIVGPEVKSITKSFELFWNHEHSVDIGRFIDVHEKIEEIIKTDPFHISTDIESETLQYLMTQADVSSLKKDFSKLTIYEVKDVEFVADIPSKRTRTKGGDAHRGLSDRLKELIKEANHDILFQSPYLVFSNTAVRSLKKMHKQNPDLRIRFSSNSLAASDHLSVFAISYKQRKKIWKSAGVDIYELQAVPGHIHEIIPSYNQLKFLHTQLAERDELPALPSDMVAIQQTGPRVSIHAKSFVIDHKIVFIGSHNFDPRSFNLNDECGLIIRDAGLAKIVTDSIERDMEPGNSWVVSQKNQNPILNIFDNLIDNISSTTPFVDFWNFNNTSCFELKEGCHPTGPRDPDFHQHYENVGQFPSVDAALKILKTRLVKALGGAAAPLM